jgi:hypothetical protein
MPDDDDRFLPASPRPVHSASTPMARHITRSISRVPLTAEEMRPHPVSRELRALMDRPTTILAEPDDPAALTLLEATCRTAFRMAIGGNVKAMTIVFDRLEGRVGVRSGEIDPASDTAREGVQQAIEDIVRAFTEARLAEADDDPPGDAALDITAPDPPTTVPPGRPTHDAIDAVGEHARRLDGPAE